VAGADGGGDLFDPLSCGCAGEVEELLRTLAALPNGFRSALLIVPEECGYSVCAGAIAALRAGVPFIGVAVLWFGATGSDPQVRMFEAP
jgi:hypothetical protein